MGIVAAMAKLTKSMCWELMVVEKDKLNGVAAAIYKKPISNDCYEKRLQNEPPMCADSEDANAAWYLLIYLSFCLNCCLSNI